MRRIQINKKLKNFADDFSDNLFTNRKARFEKPIIRINNLLAKYPRTTNQIEHEYLLYLSNGDFKNYYRILKLKPSEQAHEIDDIDNSFPGIFYDSIGNKITSFGEDILNAFRYKDLRHKEGIEIIEKLPVKTCAYCNAQLAVVINHAGKKKARLELDHFFPKTKYPYLSTTFFNLIPSCSPCNRAKSAVNTTLNSHFHLYSESTDLEQFRFRLEDKGVVDYWSNRKKDDLKIIFEDHPNAYDKQASTHNKILGISALYDTQKDVVEELLEKLDVYSDSHRRFLLTTFKNLFPDKDFLYRMIIGNYSNEEQIHKRPLAKFTQDLVKDLKLDKLLK